MCSWHGRSSVGSLDAGCVHLDGPVRPVLKSALLAYLLGISVIKCLSIFDVRQRLTKYMQR